MFVAVGDIRNGLICRLSFVCDASVLWQNLLH